MSKEFFKVEKSKSPDIGKTFRYEKQGLNFETEFTDHPFRGYKKQSKCKFNSC